MDENFIGFFREQCEGLNLPVPNFVVNIRTKQSIKSSPISIKSNHDIEMNLQCDDANIKNPLKLECKGYKLPMIIFDTIFFTTNRFNTITSLSLINCRIRADGIVKIARNIITTGYINDINLDMNPNSCGNHYLLCSRDCNLRYLSLKFCNLGDSGVEKIADELKYRDNCDVPKLVALNLAHNKISDVGATFIAEQMLHTNRSIQSLNLSGNWITDTGALSILSQLYMFPLTHEEIVDLRKRKYVQLIQQEEKLNTSSALTLNKIQGEPKEGMNRSTITKKKVKDLSKNKNRSLKSQRNNSGKSLKSNNTLQQTSSEFLNLPKLDYHPFIIESYPRKGEMMSIGNLELQHLNLSYNHVTKKTLEKMIKCIYYHNYMMLNDPSRGILHVNMKGNNILEDDELWAHLHNLLGRRYDKKDDEPERYESLVSVESKIFRSQITIQSFNE